MPVYHLYAPQDRTAETEVNRAISDRNGEIIDITYVKHSQVKPEDVVEVTSATTLTDSQWVKAQEGKLILSFSGFFLSLDSINDSALNFKGIKREFISGQNVMSAMNIVVAACSISNKVVSALQTTDYINVADDAENFIQSDADISVTSKKLARGKDLSPIVDRISALEQQLADVIDEFERMLQEGY